VLRQHVARESGVDLSAVSEDTELFSTGLLDSLSVMDLVMLVEEQSGCAIPPKAVTLENFDTINRVVGFVERLTKGKERN
jgi:acyl carrier protein